MNRLTKIAIWLGLVGLGLLLLVIASGVAHPNPLFNYGSVIGLLLLVWGDRIFEKCGIRRDEGGDGGKTLEIRGKRRLSARDGGANYQQS